MIQRICLVCKKAFLTKNYLISKGYGKYCSSMCYHVDSREKPPWNKGKTWTRKLKGKYIFCKHCGEKKYFMPHQLKKRPCVYCSIVCARTDERIDNPIKYSTIHGKVNKWEKQSKCEMCGLSKKLDWANISGKYILNRNDWQCLCRGCHIKFDKSRKIYSYKNYQHK